MTMVRPRQEHAIEQLRGDDAAGHEADGGDEARQLEVGHAEDAVSAGAAAGHARAEADEQPAHEHPDQLTEWIEAETRVEHPERPRRRPAAAEHGREHAADEQPRDERQTPSPRAEQARAREVRRAQHQAAQIFEAGGDAETSIEDEGQRERDGGDARARDGPVQRRQVVKQERHAAILRPGAHDCPPRDKIATRRADRARKQC
jgi:hypothetical protein